MGMKLAGKLCAVIATLLVAVGAFPFYALAESGNHVPITDPSFFDNGTYVFDSIGCDTSLVPVDQGDGPAMAIVDGENVTLVIDIMAPGSYDKLFVGKRSEAPNPFSSSLLNGQFVPSDSYSSMTAWNDGQGLVGPAGNSYKSVRFFIPMTKGEFVSGFNGGGGSLYVALRRSWWGPESPATWLDANDHYLTLGTPRKTNSSTALPTTEFADKIEPVKALINALPEDPYDVEEPNRAAIEEAQAAYSALPPASQGQLDSEKPVSQSYGRMLESLVWALDSLQAVDDSTTLPDGTYLPPSVSSICTVGKSDRARNLFNVLKVIVKDGHAQALIEHDAATSNTVRTGSREYPHINEDENAKSQFLIPIDLNKTFHISQYAKNPTANTVGIVYEMKVTIDEANAKPEASPSSPSGSDPAPSGQSSASNGARNNASALSAVARAQQAGTVGRTPSSTAAAKKEEQAAASKNGSTTVSPSSRNSSAADDAGTTGTATGDQGGPVDTLPITFGLIGTSTLLGFGGFTAVFYRRESRLIPWLRSA